METKILNQKDLQVAVDILKNGGLVAFATDTVFGLAALANHSEGVNKLINVKQRPDNKPFPMMVSSLDHIESVAKMTSRDRKIITRWMPGALTLILNKKETYLDDKQKQYPTIGIRMPNDTWILGLIQAAGPLLVPSANISNNPPSKSFEEVYKTFDGKIEAIVVGKTNPNTIPSTVLDASKEVLTILREGDITLDSIQHDLNEYLPMTIALAADHGGFELKEKLKAMLEKWGYEVMDFGSYDTESVDYTDTVYPAAKAVAAKDADLGIVFCGTGIGASITANKVKGIRCALVNDLALAQVTREHNDSNVLAMGGRVIDEDTMIKIVSTWLTTPFSKGERHQRRIDKIKKIEDVELDG
jgi:ribose 5-phosphate isomerase B